MWKECVQAARFLSMPVRERRIVFYAEGRKDFPFYEELIAALLKDPGASVAYITSDAGDPALDYPPERLRPFYLNQLLPLVLLMLDSKILVMTVPDLHRYHLRRSVRGANHVYLFHALCSTHMIYRFGAFDHYDTLLCAGPHQVEEIRKAETLYHLPAKQLVEAGYPRLDRLIRNHREFSPESSPAGRATPMVLIAPSWAPSNILETCGGTLARGLVEQGFRVVLRPHPEMVRRQPERIAGLVREFSGSPGIEVELDPLTESSFHAAEALITDWSGIGLEYAFATERPVLFVETPPKVNNPRHAELGITPLEVRLRGVIGPTIRPEQISAAPEALRALIRDRALYREKILRAREEAVFNVGRSGEAAARFLLDLAHQL